MENGGNLFSSQSNRHRGHDQTIPNSVNLAWDDAWAHNSSRLDWTRSVDGNIFFTNTTSTAVETAPTSSAPFFPNNGNWLHQDHYGHYQQPCLYGGEGSRLHPDPNLMCLKLGKRHYFEDANNPGTGSDGHLPRGLISAGKRCKPYSGNVVGHSDTSISARNVTAAHVPRCQVEGCHVELVNNKDYHRRHKVCEMHSKAPKVMVLGLEQRFCQQCSRFHLVSEFDDSKRSCRRRLAGHNERRRKSSHDSVSRNISQDKFIAGKIPYLISTTGCAHSLLSSSNTGSWISPSDIPSRSSAALHELIAEHRATILARQLLEPYHTMEGLDDQSRPRGNILVSHQEQISSGHDNSDQYPDSSTQVTLDLMQAPVSAFGLLSTTEKTEDEEEDCAQVWHTLEGSARTG